MRSNHPLARLLSSSFHSDGRDVDAWEDIDWDKADFVEKRREAPHVELTDMQCKLLREAGIRCRLDSDRKR